jgi:predicted transcriptional regulator
MEEAPRCQGLGEHGNLGKGSLDDFTKAENVETESRSKNFRDYLAFQLESLSGQLSLALEQVVGPYDFNWPEVEVLRSIRDAEGDFPLTRLLYPNPQGGVQTKVGQELYQRFKAAGMVSVRHSEDSPVMVEMTEVGSEFLNQVEQGYSTLDTLLTEAVSVGFLDDVKAINEALLTREVNHEKTGD